MNGTEIVVPLQDAPVVPQDLETQNTTLGGGFLFDKEQFEFASRVSVALSKSTLVPDAYKGSPANCLLALEYSNRLGISPFLFMQRSNVIHGKLGLDATIIIALCNSRGPWVGGLKFEVKGVGADLSCAAYGVLPNGEIQRGATISMAMATSEGWVGKAGSKWNTMPEQMLKYRAAAFFSRVYAPHLTLGLHTQDELSDMGEERGRSTLSSAIKELQDKMEGKIHPPPVSGGKAKEVAYAPSK